MSAPLIQIRQRPWELAAHATATELADLYETYLKSAEAASASGAEDDRALAAFNARRYLRYRAVAARQWMELGFALACSPSMKGGDEQ